ncbi:MAG TPA: hypothetical protein VEP50_17495 [bacterium]|nr:hypothetical protein [bacterium]
MAKRQSLGAKPRATTIDSQGAIQVRMDIDAGAGVAAGMGPGTPLQEGAVQLNRVIVPDGAAVLEAADTIKVGWRRTPGRVQVRWGLGEACVVAWEKPLEHLLRIGERTRLRKPQLDHEAILEGSEETSTRPLSRGEEAGIQRMPSSCGARPICVEGMVPSSSSTSVCGVRGAR